MDLHDSGAEVTPAAKPALRVVTAICFEDVYRTDYARMVRVAAMLTGSSAAAEDVVQDAFVGLYRHFDRVDDPAGYLYRSVVNGCGSRHRHKGVVRRLRLLTVVPEAATSDVDGTWSLLATLTPRRRAVVVLRFYADMPLADIGRALGCPVGTVKSLLHRALADLKEVVER